MPEKKRSSGVPKNGQSVAYRLVFVGEANVFGHRVANVTSPLLDPVLHRDGVVPVRFADVSEDTFAGRFVLDSFQMDSLAAYLTGQAEVRRQLQDALDEHLAEWDRKKTLSRGEGVWKKITVASVGLRTRPDDWDTPVPTTMFTVFLDAKWPEEHSRHAEFGDGRLTEFVVE